MSRKKYVKGFLIVILAVIIYDNLPSLPIQYYQTTNRQYGSSSDITNGALSQLNNRTYVIQFEDGEQLVSGTGRDSVILKQSGNFHFGLMSLLPFYKTISPKLVFDCYIARGNKYIGKIEIEEKITMAGLFNRSTMKKVIQNKYVNETVNVLNYKAISYEEASGINPVISQYKQAGNKSVSLSSGLDPKNPRIQVTIMDRELSFSRRLPIRQRDLVYSDTIFFKRNDADSLYPLYEVCEVSKPNRLLTYRSYNASNKLIYSKKFKLEKVDENGSGFNFTSYSTHNIIEAQ
jgi:hypothetical protein